MGLLSGFGRMPINPQQVINMMINSNPRYKQAMSQVQQLTNGNNFNAKEMVLEKFKNANMNKEQFSKFSQMAKQMGATDEALQELEQYIKD